MERCLDSTSRSSNKDREARIREILDEDLARSFAAHRPGVETITRGIRPHGANLGIAKNGDFSLIGRCYIGLHVIRV